MCHLEGGEGGSLFLKPDVFKEQVPKRSIDEKKNAMSKQRVVSLEPICNLKRFYVYHSNITLGFPDP